MADQQFCLQWNNHQSTLISVFDTLLENETLVDCTLAAEGQYLKAHRVVLCACSPFLETLLSQHFDKHPILILKDVKLSELKSMIDYMYRGEVNMAQDRLGSFLKAAESLQIKGLSDNPAGGDDSGAAQPIELQQANLALEISPHISRNGSMSPSSRTRKKVGRHSKAKDSNVGDTNLDSINLYEPPCQPHTIPILNIPATSSITKNTNLKKLIIKSEESEIVNRPKHSNQKSLPFEYGTSKERLQLDTPLLEPKTEYLKESDSEGSVEDLTLDDEMDEMDSFNLPTPNISMPGSSHDNDLSSISYQGFSPWQSSRSQSGMVFIAAQETPSSQASSQGFTTGTKVFQCMSCGKSYQHKGNLTKHQVYECGNKRPFACSLCDFTSNRMFSLRRHMLNKHKENGNNN